VKIADDYHYTPFLSSKAVLQVVFFVIFCFNWSGRYKEVLSIRIRILPSTSRKSKKNLDFCYFFFLSLMTDVNVPLKSNKQQVWGKFFVVVGICQSLTKKASGSGSVPKIPHLLVRESS
jgi:hypothetical protein